MAVCAFSLCKSLIAVAGPANLDRSPVAQVLPKMRTALPPSGIVGYINGGHDDPPALRDYYLTQYDLAPLVVTRSQNADWVIGNFSIAGSSTEKPYDLVRVRDFGNGVVLFSKKNSLMATREP